ncbi:MAG: hypothetical protein AAB898_01685, partial [Patescibacteria group bacterium]
SGTGFSLDRVRRKHPNAYRPWSEEEDARLAELHAARKTVKDISKSLGRQPGAIRSRLVKTGLVLAEGV